jgi:hypothetical protein
VAPQRFLEPQVAVAAVSHRDASPSRTRRHADFCMTADIENK